MTLETARQYVQIGFEAGRIFTPGSPLNARELFAGRSDQVDQIIDAISQKGYHVVLYGDRGVGKTSLSNVLMEFLNDIGQDALVMPRVNCAASDDFSSLWIKVLRDVSISKKREGIGFIKSQVEFKEAVLDTLPEQVAPDDVRRALAPLSKQFTMVIIFDEYDRLKNSATIVAMADTIKMLSDHGVDATIMLIGVAHSVDMLVGEHQSIERALGGVDTYRSHKTMAAMVTTAQ